MLFTGLSSANCCILLRDLSQSRAPTSSAPGEPPLRRCRGRVGFIVLASERGHYYSVYQSPFGAPTLPRSTRSRYSRKLLYSKVLSR